MRRLPVYARVSLLLLWVGMALPARAIDCQSPSPNLQFSRDIWAPVTDDPLPQHFRARVLGFFKNLEGVWRGDGRSTACVMNGPDNIPVKAPEQLKLTVTRSGDASYHFQFNIFDTSNNVRTTYGFIVRQDGQLLQVEGEGNLAITRFYSQAIRFRTQTAMRTGFRNVFGNKRGYTVLSLETVRQLELQDGELIFSKAVFHNGAVIDFSRWVFTRG